MTRPPRAPAERGETLRQSIAAALRGHTLSAREISEVVRISEREVAEHLAHLERSLAAAGERLEVEPASCKACGFTFDARVGRGRPSRCPKCKSERLSAPRYRVTGTPR